MEEIENISLEFLASLLVSPPFSFFPLPSLAFPFSSLSFPFSEPHYVAHARFQLLDSNDLPVSASWVTGTVGTYYCTKLMNISFHTVVFLGTHLMFLYYNTQNTTPSNSKNTNGKILKGECKQMNLTVSNE